MSSGSLLVHVTFSHCESLKQQHFTVSRHASARGGFLFWSLRLFELAHVLVRFDHVARFIINTNHGIM